MGLAVASVVLIFAWPMVPGGALLGFVLGISGGIVALVAVVRRGERSISVFASLVPFAFVVLFVVLEILSAVGVLEPH